ncbi:MAG: hypothetical protein R3B91_00395 [Planctomycetaceae bacterium]
MIFEEHVEIPSFRLTCGDTSAQDKSRIEEKWVSAIRRASALAGQSYLASTLANAFLLDMIAIEVLLAGRGEKFRRPDTAIGCIV